MSSQANAPTLHLRNSNHALASGHPGFRVESLVVVTTLTDAGTYTPGDMADLSAFRWLAELGTIVTPCIWH